jgi:hypothetical protein
VTDTRLVPDWLEAYKIYTFSTESPEEYHVWTALSTISGAVRRRVFFDMGHFMLYPNLYVVLVGPPGRCKKSTAMRIGRSMLDQVPGIKFTTDSITRERLIQDLSQSFVDGHSSMTTYSTEFASLLTSSGMDMVVFLTDIFDTPSKWEHRSKTGGSVGIKFPFLNLLGATTPDWIAKAMPLDTIGIGLTSRIIFIFQDTPRVRPSRPSLTKEQRELGALLVADLQQMATLHGEYQWADKSVDDHHEEWYQNQLLEPNTTGDSRLDGYFARKQVHLLKTTMLVAASRRNELVMTVEDHDYALSLLSHAEQRMNKVFAAVGTNPLAANLDGVFEYIVRTRGATKEQILSKFRRDLRRNDLDEILDTLVQIKAIKAERLSGSGVLTYTEA